MKTVPWIIIVVLMALLFLQRECTPIPDTQPCPDPDTLIIIKHDTLVINDTTYVPTIRYRDRWRNVHQPIDTDAVVAAFLETNYYLDSLAWDSTAQILVEDSVNMNRIVWRRKSVKVFPATIYKTNIVTKEADPRRKLFVGVGVGRNQQQFGLAPSLMYISRRETAYTVSFDVVNKDMYFAMYWKLNFKK